MMKKHRLLTQCLAASAAALALTACDKWTEQTCDGYNLITQKDGATLGYSPTSGIQILHEDGYAFKDLNRNGQLDVYEDWRQPVGKRVEDLAAQLSIEEIAGLMLYSNHQAIPATSYDMSTYNGKPYAESGAQPWELTDHQKKFLKDDHLRHVLVTTVETPEIAARWNNSLQAYVEGLGHGIPANNSSDPRHSARADAEFNAGGGGQISTWPGSLGMAATFSPQLMERFGQIASEEYRALGFATALSPQVDIATDPRWMRFNGTMGEDPKLSADLARAYCDGFQTSEGEAEIADGWGYHSVNTMVKHWPGGGSGEGGRDAHYGFGKYAVFPNNQLPLHKIPFTEGAFKLEGKTGKASAVMPYYTISVGQGKENVANSYDPDIITRQLREEAGFDGIVCTDWGITADEIHPGIHSGKPWGVEKLTVAERHYKALMAGVDQFGGNNDKQPVLEAYEMGVKEHGEEWMTERMRTSARRLLMNIFRTGLFENPYLDPAHTAQVVGCPEFMAEGYDAQVKSTIMLKNRSNVLPVQGKKKVYIPVRHYPAYTGFWNNPIEAREITPVSRELASKYFDVVDTPAEADLALVFIDSPNSGWGYDMADVKRGGNGYMPISLQYSDYTARTARAKSLAGGDPFEKSDNRSYRGKTVHTINKGDMDLVIATKKVMGNRPVVVSVNISNPVVMKEIEPYADALFLTFDVQNQVILELATGKHEPSGLLPFQMPADMETVEAQAEDTPRDMRCYTDADGHTYDFAYGLNWKGVIDDERTQTYK